MIQTEFIYINGKEGVKTFSDKNVYIQDENGILYPVAYNFIEYQKKYFETDKVIEE